jgi:hypothetical protein
MILTDVGGELLLRFNDNFALLFPDGVLTYTWAEQTWRYEFAALPLAGKLSTNRLHIDGNKLREPAPLNELLKDVIMLLIFGGASTNPHTARVLANCEISRFLGQPNELRQFVKERYIWVSRITAGSQSNALGQLAQQFVQSYVQEHVQLPDLIIKANAGIPGISQTETKRPISFDLVVQRGLRYVAIEVSFQVTTNSVIERKAGQAQARYQQLHEAGHRIAYVLDGAGNFMRPNALTTLCAYSDCTVAFTREELDILCQFLEVSLAE